MSSERDARLGAYFDGVAERGYMAEFSPEEEARVAQLLKEWDIRPGMKVLEPGCGAGRLTELLAEAVGSEGEVWACELSERMLERCRARRLPECVRLGHGSVNGWNLPPGHFDRILCFCVFPHFSNRTETLRHFHRLLGPNGQLWINHLESRAGINNFHAREVPDFVHYPLPDAQEFETLLKEAGFRVVLQRDEDEGFALLALRADDSTGQG
jgi:ubiquinone/menaquinone biosynthesis C-methylase UbiE